MLIKLLNILRLKTYKVYTRPYELNIVGLRSPSTNSNRFDDELHVFYKNEGGKWVHRVYRATTDPGTYWLNNPMQQQGTAILAPGQYENAYEIGMHRGQYTALVQRKPVKIIRDYDRNAVLDFFNGTEHTGLFGINIHRASLNGTTKTVDRYSAGCQVFANIEEYNEFIKLCKRHSSLYGNKFSYSLVDFRMIRRMNVRYAAYGLAFFALAGFSYWYYNEFFNNAKKLSHEPINEHLQRPFPAHGYR